MKKKPAEAAHGERCPSCGYCPHCGQSARPQVIPVPYPAPRPVYPRPYWANAEDQWAARRGVTVSYSNRIGATA